MQSTVGPVPAVILAGGQGRRIGGDKARVLLAGLPLWAHVAARLTPQVGRLAVNGRGDFGPHEVIADAEPGQGPLGGILAAMDWAAMDWAAMDRVAGQEARQEARQGARRGTGQEARQGTGQGTGQDRGQGARHVLTVAVDTPFLPADLARRLGAVGGPVAVARTPDGLHGTTALWDVALADDLRRALAQGTRKVTDWAELVGFTPVDFPVATPPAFFNINTPDDLARAEAWLA